jgi:hypothetical protein
MVLFCTFAGDEEVSGDDGVVYRFDFAAEVLPNLRQMANEKDEGFWIFPAYIPNVAITEFTTVFIKPFNRFNVADVASVTAQFFGDEVGCVDRTKDRRVDDRNAAFFENAGELCNNFFANVL